MLKSAIENLLYIATRPLSFKEIAKIVDQKLGDVEVAIKELIDEYNLKDGGIKIAQNGNQVQMITNPKHTEMIQKFLGEEVSGELTPASIETLSIVAYRQPISREDLEQIRGVNCAIILRNLLIRGLVEENKEAGKVLYRLSLDFMKHLGVADVKELPDFERLNSINIVSTLEPIQNEVNIAPAVDEFNGLK
ncbi:MAG: SMC-Scp complex subunit ScpB [Patescibacteria group bacterium]|nr:SMC-Scp complex subunit ScpB [Patescibacteria group bacterium]MDD5121646.1 SMC-Scp complex subunit ScpB [Patescibacteria group bacterium]MDD5221900.1 SMC-Scp complex subunit ScpB [Patescibacteria group bacterium]MDD5396190.1 SMC-Scp complex subunit ScpB [Patescibacteria group bacterium]